MKVEDEPDATARSTDPPRGDVISARSRMRTKYGSQSQIDDVATMLALEETLLALAVAGRAGPHGQHVPGLLALTDRRLLFLPRDVAEERGDTDLTTIRGLGWTTGGRTGMLRLITDSDGPRFTEVHNADGRDLMNAIRRIRPGVLQVEQG